MLHKLLLKIWKTESMPNEWNGAVLTPIHKKETECKSYRGISQLNTTYKILSNIIFNWIKLFTENIGRQLQAGFIQGRSNCRPNIHCQRSNLMLLLLR